MAKYEDDHYCRATSFALPAIYHSHYDAAACVTFGKWNIPGCPSRVEGRPVRVYELAGGSHRLVACHAAARRCPRPSPDEAPSGRDGLDGVPLAAAHHSQSGGACCRSEAVQAHLHKFRGFQSIIEPMNIFHRSLGF